MAEDRFWVGVHGVIVQNRRLLVLRRAPQMPYKPGTWDLPGGHLVIGEDLQACLAREVEEETGFGIEIERLLGLHQSGGPHVQAFYACRPVESGLAVRLKPDEHVDARWATLAELGKLDTIPYLRAIARDGMLNYLGDK